MFALFLARVLCEDNDEIQLLNIGKVGEIAIPAGTLVFLTLLSILSYVACGRHLDDDVPLEKIMILDDMSGSASLDEGSTNKDEEGNEEVEDPNAQPVVIDEL